MVVLPRLIKLWPWVDLGLYNDKVKFGHIGFWMVKREILFVFFFLEKIAAFRKEKLFKESGLRDQDSRYAQIW